MPLLATATAVQAREMPRQPGGASVHHRASRWTIWPYARGYAVGCASQISMLNDMGREVPKDMRHSPRAKAHG